MLNKQNGSNSDRRKKNVLYNLIFLIGLSIIIIIILLFFTETYYPGIPTDRYTQNVQYSYESNNNTNVTILKIGPITYKDEYPIQNAKIILQNDLIYLSSQTNAIGIAWFYISGNDANNVTKAEINGRFEKEDYLDSNFKIHITKLGEEGTFELKTGKKLD
jgi:hypothetical protein